MQHEVPEVNLTLVHKSSEEDVRNLETEQASPEPEVHDQNSKTESPELMVMEQSADYPPGLSTIQEVVPSGTQTFCLTVQPTAVCSRHEQDESYDH